MELECDRGAGGRLVQRGNGRVKEGGRGGQLSAERATGKGADGSGVRRRITVYGGKLWADSCGM